jgi:predicted F0F1-ATPase subunit
MKQQKNGDRIVFQSLAMIMQFGLNMLVPICMLSAVGIWLDGRLGTSCFTIILFVVGALAGGQNIYRMARRICDDSEMDGRSEKKPDRDGAKENGSEKGGFYEDNGDAQKGE